MRLATRPWEALLRLGTLVETRTAITNLSCICTKDSHTPDLGFAEGITSVTVDQLAVGLRCAAAFGIWLAGWPALETLYGAEAPDLPEATAQTLTVLRQKHQLPALAVVVVKEGRVCDRAAVGVRKTGDPTPVTPDDQFHIGSCTKSMTATLTARLIEEGRLRWDTTITAMFPELTLDPAYERVTIEQLLTHRGGCPVDPPKEAWKRAWEQQGSRAQQRYAFIRTVLSQPPEVTPGSRFLYSNQGYAVVGAILERLTGTPWETLLTEKVFEPLGMKSAGFGVPGTIGRVDQPWGHVREEGRIKPVQADNPPAIGPGGAVHCSLDDLARYAVVHLAHGGTPRLLKPETIRKLHTPPEGQDHAGGWISVNRSWAGGKALTHNGSNTMWFLVMWLAPAKDFAVIAATNSGGPDAEQGCDEAVAAMIRKWLAEWHP